MLFPGPTLLKFIAAVGLAAAAFFGYRGAGRLSPATGDAPVVRVVTTYEGASAAVVADTVTEPIEKEIVGMEGMESLRSRSLAGVSVIDVRCKRGCDINLVMVLVQNRVNIAMPVLPEVSVRNGARIIRGPSNDRPVLWLVLSGSAPLAELSDLAENELKWSLVKIPETGLLQFTGLRARTVRIWLDPEKLAAYNLTTADVQKAIGKEHAEPSRGSLRSKRIDFHLRGKDVADRVKRLNRLVIAQNKGAAIYLRDVAAIETGEEARGLARFDGKPVVAVGVDRLFGTNPLTVCRRVKQALPRLRRLLPRGVELKVVFDYSALAEGQKALLIKVVGPAGIQDEQMARLLARCEQRVTQVPEVAGTFTTVGTGPGEPANEAQIIVPLKPSVRDRATVARVIGAVRQALKKESAIQVAVSDAAVSSRTPPLGFPIDLVLQGPEWTKVVEWSQRLCRELQAGTAVTDVLSDYRAPVQSVSVDLDRTKMKTFGVRMADVMTTLQVYFGDRLTRIGGRDLVCEIRLRQREKKQLAPEVGKLKVRNDQGEMVPLGTLVTIKMAPTDTAIHRFNQRRAVEITANLANGLTVAQARARCYELAERLRKELRLSARYQVAVLGNLLSISQVHRQFP
jgi:multidrug efflux pump subunit AcrB